jgi:alcohol dehydrogenase class IV
MLAPSAAGDADFTWVDGERLISFGDAGLEESPRLLRERGFANYALLSTERALQEVPLFGEGAATVLHVPPGGVPDAAAAVRREVRGRPLVALGGGRVIDSAKAIAGADGLDCAAVPTTLSGAEMTRFHRMPAGVDAWSLVRPSLVIAVPRLMVSQPPRALAASAMNALAHAVEALYAPLANPVAELAALRAIELFGTALPPGPDRRALALAASLAGYAVGQAGLAVHHAVCQTLVRTTGSPHAETNAVMLPHFARAMAPRVPAAMQAVARTLGVEDENPIAGAERIAELAALSGHTRLTEVGVTAEQLDEVVSQALAHPAVANAPEPLDGRELRSLLEAAL